MESLRKIKVGKLNKTNQIATKTHICLTSWGLFTSKRANEINKADKPPKKPKPQAFPETLPIFLSLGLGFSLPYLLLALFPSLITKMPRPGEWMNTLKEFFAFPMFATSLWLLWVFSFQTTQDSLISLLITILLVSTIFWFITKSKSKSKYCQKWLCFI